MEEQEAHSGGRESSSFVAVGKAWESAPMTEGCAVGRLIARGARAPRAADPTYGFTSVRLDEGNFVLQRPYDEASGARYSFDGSVRKLWVLASDKPHARQSHTSPRTEIRMAGYDYSSGVWQFEGYGYVPSGTTGVSIMQVFGAGETATTLMLHVYDGALRYYDRQVVEDAIYDRWFRLNVVHDVEASTLTVYIDGEQKLHVHGRGGNSHFFKFGVYAQNHDSSCMESRWKDVRIFQEPSIAPLAMSSTFPSVNFSYKDLTENFREAVSFHVIASFSWLRVLPSRPAMSAFQEAASPASSVLKKEIADGCTHRASATIMLVSVAS
ncbi:citrate-binding protein-like [Triticum dicoccoides]|uniref:citrate-binding protein-like n=1 Tax=Triticum dicoccoides TaxID=85692 RepID=UPI0018916A3A|nr:citrate-binding protein-like [Triticum dicoccoides]